jgi:hypothetical protein
MPARVYSYRLMTAKLPKKNGSGHGCFHRAWSLFELHAGRGPQGVGKIWGSVGRIYREAYLPRRFRTCLAFECHLGTSPRLTEIEEEFALGNAINRKTSSQMAFLEAD